MQTQMCTAGDPKGVLSQLKDSIKCDDSPPKPLEQTRCGGDWADANSHCYASCRDNGDCPAGQTCKAGLTTTCWNTCAPDWGTAVGSQSCTLKKQCNIDGDCPAGQTCFAGNALGLLCPVPRCGVDWGDANAHSWNKLCPTGSGCDPGQQCWLLDPIKV